MTLTTSQPPGIGAPLPRAPRQITETAPARAELMRAVAERERAGEPPPCRLVPEPFTSDQAAERRRAAELCARCPLAALCRSYAAEAGEVWGVWGGVDRSADQKTNQGT